MMRLGSSSTALPSRRCVTGSFSLWQAGLQFVIVSLGGLLIGLVIGWPVAWLHRHLDDAPIEITITLLTPYAAYLLADALQVSGVLAVLSAGLYLSRQSSRFFSSNTRLQANAVWNVLVFLLNGLIFLLIGLQLRSILETIAGQAPAHVDLGSAAHQPCRHRRAHRLGLSCGLPATPDQPSLA